MDRSWMYLASRASAQYVQGVESFLDFAFEKSRNHGKILCPCIDCLNMSFLTRAVVYDHLICSGFKKNYSIWKDHGEVCKASSSRMMSEDEGLFSHDMDGLLGDLFPAAPLESRIHMGESEINAGPINSEHMDKNEKKKFDDLLKEAEQKIYMDAKYTKLSCLVHLYHLKSLNGWSNKSFSMLLEFLQDLLPIGNLMPKTTHQVKKILANLGLSYEKIHACPNGCMLFWDGNEKEEVCSICGASRWKSALEVASNDPDEVAPNDPDEVVGPQKKKATNILQRWKTTHPADGLAWKDFDERYPEFSSDPRNVRLGITSDGFNPFRTMNVSYSIWPVFVIPYNLPPWYVMKQSNFILSLLIPCPKGPANKIDVYMQPLIKELEDLWEKGVETFDVATKQMFRLKAAVHSTISDFSGYANLFGWSTKGEYACPMCAFDKSSKWLEHGRKLCYMSHRRWLQHDHCWRKDTKSFDGDEELRYAPAHRSGKDILNHLDHIDFLNENVDKSPWKKKSIFFKLPYWKHLLLPHSLDVMHIEKNVHICLKDLTEDDLEFLESRVAVTLCKLEKIFHPSFFIVMVHLVIHLVREVRFGGPTPYRWMYPIERDLSTLKSYVNNKAFPEGSIAEGNDDDDDQNEIETSNSLCLGQALGLHMHSNLPAHKRKSSFNSEIDEKSLKQAHRYVKHKSLIKGQNRKRRLLEFKLEKIHCKKFSAWFQKGLFGQSYRFHTKNHESLLKSQNSGVVVTVMGTSPAQGMVNFYGSLKEIVELNYSGKIRVVLFRCDWVDINQGCKRDEFGITLVNFSYVTHTRVNLHDDPFVLASQDDKVLYAQDPTLEGWFAVRQVKVSDAFNMGCNGDQNSLYSIPRTFDVPSLHRIDVDGDDEIDATPNVEDEESKDEDNENSYFIGSNVNMEQPAGSTTQAAAGSTTQAASGSASVGQASQQADLRNRTGRH
ncbi:transposon, En/Spm-like protein [Tanacetum coccineum]